MEINYFNWLTDKYQNSFSQTCLYLLSDFAENSASVNDGQVINATITFTPPET